MNTTRSRWAAIGAAIAVTLGAGGIGITHATTDSSEGPVSAFFPIEPCRLADNAAITEDSSITLNGWGMTGNCDLPNDITGLAANVTAVNATSQTNIRFYAQGGDVPETANLNPSPGAAPTPNAVNITLNDTNGQFQVYNRFGSVGVFIDIMGYYDNHTHDDRYYTEDEIDAIVDEPSSPGGVPDAVGLIDSDGTVNSATSNVTSSWNPTLERYEIEFSDFDFFFTTDVALVTSVNFSVPLTVATSSIGGDTLLVILRNAAGDSVQGDFSFAVWNTDS